MIPVGLLIKLGLGWSRVKKAASGAVGWVVESRMHAMIVVTILAIGYGYFQSRQADKWHTIAKECQGASKANRAAAVAQNKAWEDRSTARAVTADRERSLINAPAIDATRRYADAYRVRRPQGAGERAPAAPGQGADTRLPDALPPDPDMVAIARADLQACTDWTLDGLQTHNLAVDKILAGDAIVDPAFGNPPK